MKKVKLYESLYHWPDGIFAKKITPTYVNKIPGRTLIKNLKLPNKINKVYIIGNLSNKSKKYLLKLYRKKIVHRNVPFGTAAQIFEYISDINFKKSDLIILTIPTPKQEQGC